MKLPDKVTRSSFWYGAVVGAVIALTAIYYPTAFIVIIALAAYCWYMAKEERGVQK